MNYTPIYKPGETILKKQINHVICYTPYGKMLREEVLNKERFLTTQHERDQETGLDYRGARYYDSDVARFLSLDPHAKDYPSLSDYVYVGANPIAFIDPDGKTFIIPRESQREQVLNWINMNSRHTYATNDNGEVYVKEWNTNEEGSEYYSDRFVQGINSNKIAEIIIYEKNNVPYPATKDGWLMRGGSLNSQNPRFHDIDGGGGGATFPGSSFGAKNSLVYVTGNSTFSFAQDDQGNELPGTIEIGPEDILMHELVSHVLVEMLGSDTGEAVANENKARKELGKVLRSVLFNKHDE